GEGCGGGGGRGRLGVPGGRRRRGDPRPARRGCRAAARRGSARGAAPAPLTSRTPAPLDDGEPPHGGPHLHREERPAPARGRGTPPAAPPALLRADFPPFFLAYGAVPVACARCEDTAGPVEPDRQGRTGRTPAPGI